MYKEQIEVNSLGKVLSDAVFSKVLTNDILKTGFEGLDKYSNGIKLSSLVLLGGAPHIGTTDMATTIATNAYSIAQTNSIYFSLKESRHELALRMLLRDNDVPFSEFFLQMKDVTQLHEFEENSRKLKETKIYIYDSIVDINKIIELITEIKSSINIELIIIDNLQLVYNPDGTYLSILEKLKYVSLKFFLTIIVIFEIPQISNSNLTIDEFCANSPSVQKDLPASSILNFRIPEPIDSLADFAMIFHRDEYYGIKKDAFGFSTENCAEVHVVKNNDGSKGSFGLKYYSRTGRIENL